MKTAKPRLHTFETPEALHEALAIKVADDLAEAIEQKGYATLMVSGGNTPRPFFKKLSTEPVLWDKVRISLVDERWVSPDSDESNEQLVRTTLLTSDAKQATFYGMFHEGEDDQAQKRFNALLSDTLSPLDVVILGMGTDGHTASLFPKRPELTTLMDMSAGDLCGFCEAPSSPHKRFTLSLNAIASASHCYLHIEGEQKMAVYQKALDGDDIMQMPIRAVMQTCQTTLETFYA